MQKSKMAAWGGFTNSCEKKRSEKQREKERYKHLNTEFQRIARREKKAFLSDQCKEIEENNTMGKTRDLFKKSRDTKGTFHVLKRKLQHFGHLMQSVYSFEKTLMLGRTGGRRRRGQQRMRWLDGITDSMDMSLG